MAETARTIRNRVATAFPGSMLTTLPGIERLTKTTAKDGTPFLVIVTKDEKCFAIYVRDNTDNPDVQEALALARRATI